MRKQIKNNKWLCTIAIIVLILISCKKDLDQQNQLQKEKPVSAANSKTYGHLKQTKTYTSDVAIAWMNMQLQLMRTVTGIPNVAFARPFAYSGITLYEAVEPGMPAYQSLEGQLNGLKDLLRI